ncbi:MAG: signal peptidase I [Candidatus Arcticimaribacter sp.]|nr:signal peptidase I [Flavobacteriaceae bacterium]PSR10966.1 MAG: signal peptidase I [Candidatus Arcticimaribacter sp.]PTL98470.1 MAG: signal peptidase I [Candidatus Arcticimaribacter sp.]
MTASEWIVFILAIQVVHFLGTFRLYQKAGRKSWEAIVPVYNAIVLMQIIRRPKWWVILLFVPIINLMMFPVIWVETLRSFGRNRSIDTILGILTFGLYIFIPNFDSKTTYDKDRDLNSKTWFGEWISALLFAIIAATLVHSYFIQPYIIPTGSLEKTLLIGDFLFVSKFHYGARTPTSAVSFPMVHDTIPIIKKRSYLKKPQLPYFRLPGFQDVKRNDIVVFSWPADTVRKFFVREKGVQKPIDKKSNYVKRCVGTPGDSLEIINGFVHINGEKSILPDRAKTQYTHYGYNSKGVSSRKLLNAGYKDFTRKYRIENITQERYNALQPYILGRLSDDINNFIVLTPSAGIPPKVLGELRLSAKELLDAKKDLTLTIAEAKEILNTGIVDSIVQKVTRTKRANTNFFPNAIPYNWNEDNFGPILIPKAGMTVEINETTLPLYKKIIREYEKNELTKEGSSIFINGKETTSYTFQQDYYWMMGDNRHRSEDSRYWGYVPEDHVVGKPVLVWFSIEGINDGIKNWRIRWDRIMTTVGGNGEPISFFPYVLALFLGWQGFVYFRKRKKA